MKLIRTQKNTYLVGAYLFACLFVYFMYNLRLEILKIYLSNNNTYINKDRFKRNNKYLIHLPFL
jgi:hypothetical protein